MYHPTGRVLTVLEMLQARGGVVSGAEMARRLGTDVRSVRRYIQKLDDVGVPIDSVPGRSGGYRLKPGHKLPPLLLTPDEGAAAFLALTASPWLELDQDGTAVEGALSKIAQVLPAQARLRVQAVARRIAFTSSGRRQTAPDAKLLFELSEAAQRHHCVQLTYGPPGRPLEARVVEPCGLVGHESRWYLVAWCRTRRDYRTFRLDRIDDCQIDTAVFAPHKGFDFRAFARQQLVDYPRRYRLVVWFDAEPSLVRAELPDQWGDVVAEERGCRVETRVDDLGWASSDLLGTGLEFHVREPEELKTTLAAIGRRALACAKS